MKKITVFVITYNQEDVINRAMDSILSQKEWGLYQVIIGDDCSKDRTYDILLDYQKQYPGIVRPIRNEKNMGIYGNLQNLLNYRDDSDLYLLCSGDDALCEGFFKAVQELIVSKNISLDEKIGIYSDWKAIDPMGKETIKKHNIVLKKYRLWGLQMRGIIGTRSLLYSKKVIDSFRPVILDRGLRLSESLFDSQPARIIEKAYYIPKVTSIYYTGIGVSTSLSNTGYATTQNIEKWEYLLNNQIVQIRNDKYYAKYQIARSRFIINPCMKYWAIVSWFHFWGLYPFSLKGCIEVLKESILHIQYMRKNK